MNSELPKMNLLNDKETSKMLSDFIGRKDGWVFVGEKKWFMPAEYLTECSNYYNFEARSDDTWIITFPRSGTTWTQELIWLLSNDLDFSTANSTPLDTRFPYLELSLSFVESKLEIAQSMPSPRLIKTHFSLNLIPNVQKSNCKKIYVARNPKDVAVSYYHYQKCAKIYNYQGDFETFWDYFKNNKLAFGPYWEHVKEAWAQRHNPNFLFLFYEEMAHDLLSQVKRVAKFLGKSYTDEQYQKLVEHLQFSNMKNNRMVNVTIDDKVYYNKPYSFIRQGKSQAWHNTFTYELNIKANEWIKTNLQNTDLKFPFIDIYS